MKNKVLKESNDEKVAAKRYQYKIFLMTRSLLYILQKKVFIHMKIFLKRFVKNMQLIFQKETLIKLKCH